MVTKPRPQKMAAEGETIYQKTLLYTNWTIKRSMQTQKILCLCFQVTIARILRKAIVIYSSYNAMKHTRSYTKTKSIKTSCSPFLK